MVPVDGSIDRPGGSVPWAEAVVVAVDDVSVDPTVSGEIAEPEVSVWAPGFVTATVLVTVQVNEVDPTNPAESVTVTDTG